MKEEQGGSEKESAKKKAAADERYPYTKEAGIEREGMARSEQSALPTEGMGEKPEAGYWDDMNPKDSSDMSMNKSRFGVFEKEGGSGPTVIKPGRDFGKGKDPRSLNQSGVYAEKDAQTWKEMAKSAEARTPSGAGRRRTSPARSSARRRGRRRTAEKTGGGRGDGAGGHAGPALARRALGEEPEGRRQGDDRDRRRAGDLRAALAR